MSIEERLQEIATRHDLYAVSITLHRGTSGASRIGAAVHWEGPSIKGNPCCLANGATVDEAVTNAVAKMYADRVQAPQTEAVQ